MTDSTGSPVLELVGRGEELLRIRACLRARRNVLLEGAVGVGKTHLALAVTKELGVPVFRVDGDSRYSEQKLSGWFDPPTVIQKGFSADAFMPGPLVEAMKQGGVLFINELNRLPEGVQNVLLPAIDERMIDVPRLGVIRAAPGFLVIATQNPKEFVATSHLSEAILDRFELVVLDYQSEAEEIAIVSQKLGPASANGVLRNLAVASVRLARLTRNHPRVRRGASVRAAISVSEIASVFLSDGLSFEDSFLKAVLMALPTRIEIEREAENGGSARDELDAMLKEWTQKTLDHLGEAEVKKKP
jgi:MoxR-like ATPase